MSSRNNILNKLRMAQKPFQNTPPNDSHRKMVPMDDTSPKALIKHFVTEAKNLKCGVYEVDNKGAIQQILNIIGEDKSVLAWDFKHIPIIGLEAALNSADITVAAPDDASVRVGITGADAALAATGSLVIHSGPGKYRTPSLLPEAHIAVITLDQLLPDLETWFAVQRRQGLNKFREASKTFIITGPSKTADIGQELILGAHGPIQVHIILISK